MTADQGGTDGSVVGRVLAGCAAGDERSWAEFLALFGGPLRGMALKALSGDEDDVEDVVQEALLRLVRSLGTLRTRRRDQLLIYLRRTVVTVVTDLVRERTACKRTGKAIGPPRWDPPDPEEELLQKDAYLRLLARVVDGRHPARDTRLVHGVVVVGWTSQEIATGMGLSASGVDSALRRIRQRNGAGGRRRSRRRGRPPDGLRGGDRW